MPDTTDISSRQEAVLLWNDTKRILAQLVGTDRQRAMMDACEPVAVDDTFLRIRTGSSYAKHNLENSYLQIREALSEAAFQPMEFTIEYEAPEFEGTSPFPDLITKGLPSDVAAASILETLPIHPSAGPGEPADVIPIGVARTTLSEDEFRRQVSSDPLAPATAKAPERVHHQAPPVDNRGEADSHFTFDTFVEGVENQFALVAAKQVANGNTSQFNPLFIYGDSGLGKTHLLLSIKNYIAANDPTRICTYRTAREFINDYTTAMAPGSDRAIKDALTDSYREVDVLIIDDIQHLRSAQQTVEFFFDTFNYLISNGKQIVLAADVPPAELGMPERISSRMAQGFEVSIQLPELELKRNLIRTFYQRDKADNLPGYEGTIPDDVLDTMAEYCGNNIRLIKAYVQQALFLASQIQRSHPESVFTVDDAEVLAKERGLFGHHTITVDEIQSVVEREMHIGHAELISNKRNKEIAQARHVAIWLCRQLTDNTYKDIGQRFGGRSHTTCLHSCDWVDKKLRLRTDRAFIDTVSNLRRKLESL